MFDKLKKALGFGPADEDDNEDLLAHDPDFNKTGSSPFAYVDSEKNELSESDIEQTIGGIFEHVVQKFNEALPDFLKRSVDPEKEKKELYDSLSQDVKTHLINLEKSVNHKVEEAWRAERERMQNELKTLTQTAKDIEMKRNELKSQQLSSDRQKRAMTERIHELEKQVLAAEAEKEQLELENKSMINKVKVAQVHEQELEELRQLVLDLQNQLSRGQSNLSAEENKESGEKVVVDPNPELEQRIKVLEDDNAALTDENNRLTEIESKYETLLKEKKELEKNVGEIEKMKASIKDAQKELHAKDAEIKKLKEDVLSAQTALKENAYQPESTNDTIKMPDDIEDDEDILSDADWIVQPVSHRVNKTSGANKSRTKKQNQDDGQMSLW